jgi:hypothetical protein
MNLSYRFDFLSKTHTLSSVHGSKPILTSMSLSYGSKPCGSLNLNLVAAPQNWLNLRVKTGLNPG